jgi:hypothetical protein
VALAAVDVYLVISVFTISVEELFVVELLVVLQRVVGPKSVVIDGHRPLFVVGGYPLKSGQSNIKQSFTPRDVQREISRQLATDR